MSAKCIVSLLSLHIADQILKVEYEDLRMRQIITPFLIVWEVSKNQGFQLDQAKIVSSLTHREDCPELISQNGHRILYLKIHLNETIN